MRFEGLGYRAHDPRWAFDPLSGAGAASHGGRFNPPGVAALYLALSIEGMFLEVGHGFAHRFDPLTVCCYDVDIEGVVDLRSEDGRQQAGIGLDQLGSAWAADRLAGRKPASWAATERLMAEGVPAILVPSFATGARPGMANLVLWRWGERRPHKVVVYDPARRLPRDRSSW